MDKIFLILFFSLILSVAVAQVPPPAPAAAVAGQEKAEGVTEVGDEVSGVVKLSRIQSFLLPFEYNREEVRDPFEAQGSSAPLEPGQVYGPFLAMQKHKLSSYRLKGLLWKTSKPVAIFRSPDGKDYRLTIKDYIGENFGYIAMIREREVVVIQTIEENNRRYSTTKVVFLER